MARDHVGFDCEALVSRLFAWCKERHGSEISTGVLDELAVERFLKEHRNTHSSPVGAEQDGVLQAGPRRLERLCQLCGVAFAVFELRWYFANAAQAQKADAFRMAAETLHKADPRRVEFESEAEWRFAGLFSRPLWTKDRGRPSLGLARATAQHLRRGGFTYSEIATLMCITAGAAEMRCRTEDMRSVVPCGEALGPLASRA